MTPRLCVAASLLTALTLFADQLPAKAQGGTSNSSPTIPPLPSLPAVRPRIPSVPLAPSAVPIVPQRSVPARPIVVAELVERLRTADTGERREIIQQLSDTQQKIVPALVKVLDDPDPLVKSGVAEALGNHMDDATPAIPGLIAMTSDPRQAIVPRPQFPTPLFALPIPRSPYLYSEERRRPSIPPNNPANLLRITAIAALGKIGLPARTAASPPLLQALQDPDPWVRLNATWALAEIGASVPLLSHWLEALQSPDPDLRRNAAATFLDERSLLPKVLGAEADDSTISPLIAALKDDELTVRDAAKEALKLLRARALPGLVQALKAPEPIVRLEAADLVGKLGAAAQSAVPDLLPLLQDTGRYVLPDTDRFGVLMLPPLAIPTVAFPGSRSYPPPPGNPEQLVRVNAAIALGTLGDRRAIPPLSTALKDDNPWMQLATGWALLRLGETEGLPVVGRLVQHPNRSIQTAALYQLEGYGSQSAPYILPYYKAQLESTDDNQRNGAIISIGRFGVAALDLVPRLRAFLTGNQKNSPGYAATILGQIAQRTAIAWNNGSLSTNQRRQAIAEFTKVLDIMQAPNARFNREPVNRVRNSLAILKSGAP